MGGWRQLRLLLWKDYLIRKRKWITLAGIVWATGIMLALYIVRVNIDNVDYPTCQFPARALPNAGLLTFMQSFVCSVSNECQSMDKFDEIPTYEKSKLTQLSRKFSPLISNTTVLETATVVPDALKLVAKLAEVADEPTFLQISKNGLRVEELFSESKRAKRYLSKRLELDEQMMQGVMEAKIRFEGIFQSISRCSKETVSRLIKVENQTSLELFASKLCSLPSAEIQTILMDLFVQIDFNRYIKMVGTMYYKLECDNRITELADTITAVFRVTKLQSFLPKELATIFGVDLEFSYFHMSLFQKFLDLFKPTFSDAESYKSLRELADSVVSGVQFLSNFIDKDKGNTVDKFTEKNLKNVEGNEKEINSVTSTKDNGLTSIKRVFNKASEFLKEAMDNESGGDVFKIMSQLFKLVHKLLPDKTKHDVLLYSTLLTKLIEGTNKIIITNSRIEEVAYNVSLRNPEALKVLVSLPGPILEKGFDALTDAEKTQLATSRIDSPGQIFCDLNKLQTFFVVSKIEAMRLKDKLCTDIWKNYIKELVSAFGVYDVQNNINEMAALFLQETLGRDTSDALYSLDYDFEVLKSFVHTLSSMEPGPNVDWSKVFNVDNDSEFMGVLMKKSVLGKRILITAHGSLAKAVVKQNLILSFKLAPLITDSATLVSAINRDLEAADQELVGRTKGSYPQILMMVLKTALDENKTYLSLSTHSEDIFCQDPDNVTRYVILPHTNDSVTDDLVSNKELVNTLCGVSAAIENGLKNTSEFGQALQKITSNNQDSYTDKHWTLLITGLRDLYVKLERDYPYLFQFSDYGMDKQTKEQVALLYEEAKVFWFGHDLERSIRLSIKLGFRIFDLIDKEAFGLSSETWLMVRYGLHVISGPLQVVHDFVVTLNDLYRDNGHVSQNLPPITLNALSLIVPNIPQLVVDITDFIVEDRINTTALTTFLNTPPYWPCSNTSVADLLQLSGSSSAAVRGVETALCGTAALRKEWELYLKGRHVEKFDLKKYNTTSITPHVFLRASSVLDSLINDGSLLVEMVTDIFTDYDPNRFTWAKAGQYAVDKFRGENRDKVLRKFFTKVDTIVNSLDTSMVPNNKSLNDMLTSYANCLKADADDVTCLLIGRAVAKISLEVVSVVFENGAQDMLKYFHESNGPNATILQQLGFTRGTPLYEFKERLPELVAVLLNSYLDFGFMSQVRRASLSQFWDCQAVVAALNPPVGSAVDSALLARIEPYVCPQLLYWVSLPRGENVIIDLIAKPNYYLFSAESNTFNSSFLSAYNKTVELANYILDIANKNTTIIDQETLKLNTIENKLKKAIDAVVNYKINENDPAYRAFSEMNKKQYITITYLTRIVAIVNKVMSKIENVTVSDLTESSDESEIKNMKKELVTMQNMFRRKPHYVIELHFDVITNLLWKVNDYHSLVDALNTMCADFKDNESTEKILLDNDRVLKTFCSKNFVMMYKGVDEEIIDDLAMTKQTLMHFVTVLQNDENLDNITDINEFLKRRPEFITALKRSIKYSYELSIPIYLKYMQDVLLHCDIITSFLSGGSWWWEIRNMYSGPYATSLLDAVEMSFDVAKDVMENLDRIHIVRLIHDMRTNDSDEFCDVKIEFSDYFPDKTEALSTIKKQLCDEEKTLLFGEIPPLLFAAQGYNSELKIPRTVDYNGLNIILAETESRLKLIQNGPLTPQTPPWITDDKLTQFREGVLNLLSKESLTKVSFGAISNLVDAGTLFLNNSNCHLCSQFTPWFKQLNLQIFKKQEYDALLCRLTHMTLEEVHHALQNDFHWDMAIRELISTRNYTKYELNKSMNEFLELVKLHLLEDIMAPTTKLTECLARNVSRNEFGNATLFISVLSHTARLMRAMTPHLHQIEGFKNLPYLNRLLHEVAHNLDVSKPLKGYLMKKGFKELEFLGNLEKNVLDGELNLRLLQDNNTNLEKTIYNTDWNDICAAQDCGKVRKVLYNNINRTLVDKELPNLQTEEFWRFPFISEILAHLEQFLSHAGRLVGVASTLDVSGALGGELGPLLDMGLQLLSNETNSALLFSLQGITEEIHPLFENASLEHDLTALGRGLEILHQFKTYLINEVDLKLNLSTLFPNPDRLEVGLARAGINNTNFWSLAAPRLQYGYIDLKPIFISKQPLSSYVCHMEAMSAIIHPSHLDVVTADDVYSSIVDQFCGMDDERVKMMIPVVLGGVDFAAVFDKLKSILLPRIFSGANLTQWQGEAVLSLTPRIAALLPLVQENAAQLTQVVSQEPIVKDLAHMDTVGGLLRSSEFLSHAGELVCGAPFPANDNRFLRAIVQSQDYSAQPDQMQLDALPTDFCRDLYRDITSMAGGKIVWSFVKPLITGKILYTPANTVTNRIMQKANESFATMIRLTSVIHSFASSFDTLEVMSSHREGLVALQSLLKSPQVRKMVLGAEDGLNLDVDIDSLFEQFGDAKSFGTLLKKGSQILRCFDLNRFRAVEDEYNLTHQAVQLSRVNEFSAGVVFLKTEQKGDISLRVEYKIRMDIENIPTTTRTKNYFWIPGPESNFIEDMRYFRGFVQIQDLVDSALIQLSRSNVRKKRQAERDDDIKWAIYTQQEPYPCFRKDFYQTSLYESQSVIVALFFSLLFTVTSVTRFIVAEKDSGNTMLMSIMGVSLSSHTLSWFLTSLTELTLTCVAMCAVLTFGRVLPKTEPFLLFVLLECFGVSVLAFCYLLSKVFSRASFGAVCAGILYLVTFMPFVLILSLEAVLSKVLKVLVCLSMSSSISYTFLSVARLEAMGVGCDWTRIWDAPEDDLSIAATTLMALVDALLYFAIGLLIDRYFGLKTLKTSITYSDTSTEKGGVTITNVTKVYGSGHKRKVVLDSVSMELRRGQVTALLGHNGAGKTTLINILTGTSKPTSGHVTIHGPEQAGCGYCPQRDVVIDALTAREHVALYVRLKSTRRATEQDIREQIDSLMAVMSLGAVCDVPVRSLSGGTRRRVCVCAAFAGAPPPTLVALDEPTAGVDPAARRDIWSMIMKLRKNRTILMTTHHLDEAELLSDHIVIMHKGQVHTAGSPIEIKRSLGSGYRLTVTYPDTDGPWRKEDETSMEEKSKSLLTVVRSSVRNAALADVSRSEVEVTLPFFDPDGLSTNYTALCSSLESAQPSLGYRSMALDCSSLEQVFFSLCHKADNAEEVQYNPEPPWKSSSTCSAGGDTEPLVPLGGPLRGSRRAQCAALLRARYVHYARNRWLLFVLLVLPMLFVALAMAFALIRPPVDTERGLLLTPDMYGNVTQYLVPQPSIYSNAVDPSLAEQVMLNLRLPHVRNWTHRDTPSCQCTETRQDCNLTAADFKDLPPMMMLPNVSALNQWLLASHDVYIDKRFGGFTSSLKNNMTNFVAWYNNKGHHALPAQLNALHNALIKAVSGDDNAGITAYTHPLKISKERLSKDTVYQHVADAGISGLVVVAYSLITAGSALYLVAGRRRHEKRLQLLCGVSPALYWGVALTADMVVILINLVLTVIVFQAFGFPVFVARNNLPAICVLIVLYGFACSNLIHVLEKAFTEPSVANMVLFCGNAFVGLAGITLLLILDIISDSDTTDNARWVLHKIFLLIPQFVLGDGLLEIAKNTIQAQVLNRFGMDTYKDPFGPDLIPHHYVALTLVGFALLALNLAIEYDCFEGLLDRFRPSYASVLAEETAEEEEEVRAEAKRVQQEIADAERPRLHTIGNINAGFIDTEETKKDSMKQCVPASGDVAAAVRLGKVYRAPSGYRAALRDLTLGIPRGQCTALLGQNGAGKSTTFAMLTGSVRPSAGRIYINGRPADRSVLASGLISYCPQSDAIDPLITVTETLQFYCRLRGITREHEVIKRTLDMFELTKYADVRTGVLSGGNKRKVCAAIAFMGRTPLVLLDEPTSGMDPVSRSCVSVGAVSACRWWRGVLVSTHALRDAAKLARRVALIDQGRLKALAPLDQCLRRFGGGYLVACRVGAGGGEGACALVWARLAARLPAAVLQLTHHTMLHFLVPTTATVDNKEVTTQLSDIFRLMTELQNTCDIEDFTVNQSSLDQMFLSITNKSEVDFGPVELDPLPTADALQRTEVELSSVTSL